jgi:biopolymer transport protein TolR
VALSATAGVGGGGEDDGAYRPLAEINVTPLVDVMLVLLIVFMVAAPLMVVGVPVDLPRTAAARLGQPREPVVVSVDRGGRLYLRREELAADALAARLAELAAADREAPVYVRGDRAVAYGEVMRLMGVVSRAGFAKVSLLAEGDPAGPAVRAR